MALTQELNHGRLEPTSRDPVEIRKSEMLITNFLKALCALYPTLHSQFESLGWDRLCALHMTKDNKCWNCGKEGHIQVRAQCPTPPTRPPPYATDARK
jgi:hypothetical protein